MSKRACYSYHPTTFVYEGLEAAYECQIEKGVYILPDHSTFIAPPSQKTSSNVYYIWTGSEWVCEKRIPEKIKEPLQEKIDNLMNVKQELLRETQDLLSKYKFFSQELEKLWVEHNTSQLNMTSNS
jgi:hypothetical protein